MFNLIFFTSLIISCYYTGVLTVLLCQVDNEYYKTKKVFYKWLNVFWGIPKIMKLLINHIKEQFKELK
jgi:hypothetical protein